MAYDGGYLVYSDNDGEAWTNQNTLNFWFEQYGEPLRQTIILKSMTISGTMKIN